MALCHAGSPRRRAPPAAVSISPTADVATSCLAGSMDAPLAPPRPLAGASSGIPQLRSCRTAPTSAKPTASNGPVSTANTSVLTPGGSLFTELRLRRARTVSGNSNASTSSSSSFSSYVPTTRSSASAAAAFSQGDTDDDEADMTAFDMEADDVPDRITGTSTGNGTRPSDEFRGVLQTATASCLPPPPYPVDPYHFYCKPGMDVAAAAAAIAELLADMDVESRFHPLKTKFRGVKYVHYSHVEFVIRVYSTGISSSSSNITSNIGTGNNSNFNINNVSSSVSSTDALLVECQRRSGSALLWDGLYHALFQRLRPIIDAAAPPCPQSGAQKKVALAKPPVDAALGVQVWQALADPPGAAPTPSSGVAAIKIMLTSKYTDAQREGCAALAVLTEDAQNVRLVASFQLLEPLVRAAEARDADMARSATGALANVALALQAIESEHKEHAIEQLRRAAGVVLARLERRVHHEWSLYALELLRESARACDAFVQSGVLLPEDVDRARRVLQHYAQHRDRQLSSLCRAALRRLGLEHEDSSMEDPVERA